MKSERSHQKPIRGAFTIAVALLTLLRGTSFLSVEGTTRPLSGRCRNAGISLGGGLQRSVALRAQAQAAATATDSASLYPVGEEIDGVVKAVRDNGLIVTLPKGDGFVHVTKITKEYLKHPGEKFNVGDAARVKVLKHTSTFLELSIKDVGRKASEFLVLGQEITGRLKGIMKDGAFVDIGAEADAFLHKSQIQTDSFVDDARLFLQSGEMVTVRVKDKDQAKTGGRVQVTMKDMKDVLAPFAKGLKQADLKVGQEMGGVVTDVRPFGAFVDVGAESDGLLHVRNIHSGFVADPKTVLQKGDRIVVKVLRSQGKLELTMVGPPPRIPPVDSFMELSGENWIDGTVTGLIPGAVLVDLVSSDKSVTVTALLPPRQIPSGKLPQIGEKVKVKITKVDVALRKVFLTMDENFLVGSLKESSGRPPKMFNKEELQAGQVLNGMVMKVVDFGAFVDVGAGDNGLIHKKTIAMGVFGEPSSVLRPNDRVTVKVKGVVQGKLELELVDVPRLRALEQAKKIPEETWHSGKVTKVIRESEGGGALVDVNVADTTLTALLEGKHMGDKRLAVDQDLRVRIIKVQADAKQMWVSVLLPESPEEEQPRGRKRSGLRPT